MNKNSLKSPKKVFCFNSKYNRKAKKLSKNCSINKLTSSFNVQVHKSWPD